MVVAPTGGSAETAAGDGGVTSIAPVGTVPNPAGGIISDTVLQLQPADAVNPGLLTSDAQDIGGAKTFKAPIQVEGDVGFSGALTPNGEAGTAGQFLQSSGAGAVPVWSDVVAGGGGIDTIAPVGSAPNPAGGTIVDDTITLQPADATNPGVIIPGDQTFGSGAKIFGGRVTADIIEAVTNAVLKSLSVGGAISNGSVNIRPPLAIVGTGTITTTISNATITGVGTSFLSQLKIGDTLAIGTQAVRQVLSIASDTSLTLGSIPSAAESGRTFTYTPATLRIQDPSGIEVAVLSAYGSLILGSAVGGYTPNPTAIVVPDNSLIKGNTVNSKYIQIGASGVTAGGFVQSPYFASQGSGTNNTVSGLTLQASPAGGIWIQSRRPDAANNFAFSFEANTPLTAAGTLLARWLNGATDVLKFDKDGIVITPGLNPILASGLSFGAPAATAGTGTITSSGVNPTTLTGTGTLFTTQVALGDTITCSSGAIFVVSKVISDTSLQTAKVINPAVTNNTFTITKGVAYFKDGSGAPRLGISAEGSIFGIQTQAPVASMPPLLAVRDGTTAIVNIDDPARFIRFSSAYITLGGFVNTTGFYSAPGGSAANGPCFTQNPGSAAVGLYFLASMVDGAGRYAFTFDNQSSLTNASAYLFRWRNNSIDKLLLDKDGKHIHDTTDASATPGDATINKPHGSVSIAAGASSVTVTNSTVTAASVVSCSISGTSDDATLRDIRWRASAGTIYIEGWNGTTAVAATGNVRVNFKVTN